MPSLTRDQVRELDRLAIEQYGLPGLVLMENAGRGAAAAACVRADATATFVGPKAGFAHPGAAAFTGAVHVLGIGAPRRLLSEFGVG